MEYILINTNPLDISRVEFGTSQATDNRDIHPLITLWPCRNILMTPFHWICILWQFKSSWTTVWLNKRLSSAEEPLEYFSYPDEPTPHIWQRIKTNNWWRMEITPVLPIVGKLPQYSRGIYNFFAMSSFFLNFLPQFLAEPCLGNNDLEKAFFRRRPRF